MKTKMLDVYGKEGKNYYYDNEYYMFELITIDRTMEEEYGNKFKYWEKLPKPLRNISVEVFCYLSEDIVEAYYNTLIFGKDFKINKRFRKLKQIPHKYYHKLLDKVDDELPKDRDLVCVFEDVMELAETWAIEIIGNEFGEEYLREVPYGTYYLYAGLGLLKIKDKDIDRVNNILRKRKYKNLEEMWIDAYCIYLTELAL
ncbi:MAG: hypothetical protein PHH04_03160 [Thomasclavelia sp.]|nr:hypothetical protein [Thomasclavelia sp.]